MADEIRVDLEICKILYSVKLFGFLLNQVQAGLWPVCAWFLKIDSVWIIGMPVCLCV